MRFMSYIILDFGYGAVKDFFLFRALCYLEGKVIREDKALLKWDNNGFKNVEPR